MNNLRIKFYMWQFEIDSYPVSVSYQAGRNMNNNWIEKFLEEDDIRKNITSLKVIPAKKADYLPFPENLHDKLKELLRLENIENLYSHQSKAISSIFMGNDTAVVTGVASGKSLCYQLPVLQSWINNPLSRSLFLFPTKALAQDQQKELAYLSHELHKLHRSKMGGVGIYDGDTPSHQRSTVIKNASFIFTNPDMLHLGILPHHTKWAEFFSNLRYVIIDEVHMYRGIFGSQFANVMRRLQRIASFYGADIQFICTSATLANTQDFISELLGRDVTVVSEDGSPHGSKYLAMYNPPLINEELAIRRSAMQETIKISQALSEAEVQSLIFAHTRRLVELIVSYLQRRLKDPDSVLGYRSGYLAAQRREIEKELKTGDVSMVIATNALELGIDIGSLDAVIINNYPGSIASTLQQWGRAGRTGASSLGMLVAGANLIDQYLVKNPEYIFGGTPEQALINPDNPFILLHQLECALFEKPFKEGESFGDLKPEETSNYLNLLQKYGKVRKSREKYFWASDTYPASSISLRTTGSGEFLLQVNGKIIGKVDEASALWMVHPQAVYLHNGVSYLVEDLDLEKRIATLQEKQLDYYTQSISKTEYELMQLDEKEDMKGCVKYYGQVKVKRQVTGFRQIKWGSQEVLNQIALELPEREIITQAYWFAIDENTVKILKDMGCWNNEANNYGMGWRKLADKIRERDNYTCRGCGKIEDGKAFHVHHKTPYKTFHNSYEANKKENLVTLCPACHKLAEQEAYIQSTLAGLSWLLQNLSPLLLMCDLTDISVNSDGRCSLADDSPAIVIYDSAPGGIGLSERLFNQHRILMDQAKEIVTTCPCANGCPACTGPVAESGEGAKQKVEELLKLLT